MKSVSNSVDYCPCFRRDDNTIVVGALTLLYPEMWSWLPVDAFIMETNRIAGRTVHRFVDLRLLIILRTD